jgi:hypothetical protein
MNEYSQAFVNGLDHLPVDCNLTDLYGRITRGITDEDFSLLSQGPHKRLSWVFDHETLLSFLRMSHLDMLIHSGHTIEWIRYQLNQNRQFKLILCSLPSDEVKLATWDGIFELLSKVYPEIDLNIWSRYSNQLKQIKFEEIDPEGFIIKNYYLGYDSDEYMNTKRFLSLKDPPTLLQVRAFLYHQIGLNELFRGDGRTLTHEGVLSDKEYLTINRPVNQLNKYILLDINPILPLF